MPFPEKWNITPVARLPDAVPQLKEWVEGLSKDVAMRPPSGDDDILTKPSSPRQDKEKKRKRAPSSPSSEKKKPRKRLARKPKKSTSARGSSEPEGGGAELHLVREAGEEAGIEASGDTGKAPQEALGPIDIAESPSFTDLMFNEAQGAQERPIEGAHRSNDPFRIFFDGMDSAATEDTIGFGDLEIPRKSLPSEASGPSSSPKLVDQFPALSANPDRKKSIVISFPEDARVLSAPVGASVLHHETFLRYRDELKQLKAKVRELTEKRDAFKLLSEEIEWEVKNLRAKLEVARKEHADLVEQVQQKPDRIDKLRAEMDIVKAETDEWRGRMDRLASEKELRAAKERAEVQIKKVEELQSRLGSAVSDRESLAKELRTAKSEVIVVKAEADEMVAQYKAHAEAAQDLVKTIVEHIKWQSRREALEEVHFRGFDLSAEIKNAKVLEAEARKLAYAEEEDSEESEDLGKSEGGGGPEGDDAAPDED
nr:protein maph-9-like [Nicotiana tomentosiformis]